MCHTRLGRLHQHCGTERKGEPLQFGGSMPRSERYWPSITNTAPCLVPQEAGSGSTAWMHGRLRPPGVAARAAGPKAPAARCILRAARPSGTSWSGTSALHTSRPCVSTTWGSRPWAVCTRCRCAGTCWRRGPPRAQCKVLHVAVPWWLGVAPPWSMVPWRDADWLPPVSMQLRL